MAAIDILVAAKLLYDACKITQCEECPLSNMCNIGEVSGYIIGQPHEWELPQPNTREEKWTQ